MTGGTGIEQGDARGAERLLRSVLANARLTAFEGVF